MAQELKHRKGWVAVKELELRRANSKGWAVVGRTSIEQEETAEVIVPDAQPDIWQVWDASTCLLLQRKEVREGQAALYGLMKVTILYQPEGTGGVERMEATLPFDAAPELPGLTRQSLLYVSPKVLGTETRLLNPRKILVRVAYQLDLTAFGPAEQGVPSQVEEPGPYGICQKTGEWHSDETVHVQEKNFTYQDTLVLPGGRPDAERLLATRTACACHEAKVIGSKLVFKGEAAVRLLYQAGWCGADCRLPPALFPAHGRWRKQPGQQRRPRPGLYRLHLHARRRGPAELSSQPGAASPGSLSEGRDAPAAHRPLQYIP